MPGGGPALRKYRGGATSIDLVDGGFNDELTRPRRLGGETVSLTRERPGGSSRHGVMAASGNNKARGLAIGHRQSVGHLGADIDNFSSKTASDAETCFTDAVGAVPLISLCAQPIFTGVKEVPQGWVLHLEFVTWVRSQFLRALTETG